MERDGSPETVAEELRVIWRSDPSRAARIIEEKLERRTEGMPDGEKEAFLSGLLLRFEPKGAAPPHVAPPAAVPLERNEFGRLFSLFLGRKVSTEDLAKEECLETLAHSLNTVFDTLNGIIEMIDTTLLGRREEMETIRQIIGAEVARGESSDSLQQYLDRIRKAFLVSHKAFQEAARQKVDKIVSELDPATIAGMSEGGLRFGPLRKAELFDIYTERFGSFRKWVESGLMMEELLREFESRCQKSYKTGAGTGK